MEPQICAYPELLDIERKSLKTIFVNCHLCILNVETNLKHA